MRFEVAEEFARELEAAREVQSRLFPREAPRLATLECAGGCLEAAALGGDYYDFFGLGPGRIAMALGDLSGKGVAAALLMAHLQAALRSQVRERRDLPSALLAVNRVLFECTAPERYATLFLGRYDDETRRLRFVNCGHTPPLLLRHDDRVERLGSTATALGLFHDFRCTEAEVALAPGDLLALFSDGVVEAHDRAGCELGEERLLDLLAERAHLPLAGVPEEILQEVRHFSGPEPQDDLTLVLARARR